MLTFDYVQTRTKEIAHFLPQLGYVDLASLLTCLGASIRNGQSLGRTLDESPLIIEGITDFGGGLLPYINDVSDDLELMMLASICTAHLMQAYHQA